MEAHALRIHGDSGSADGPSCKLASAKKRLVRTSEHFFINGKCFRIEFVERGAPPSKVKGTIVGLEDGGNGQFRLVPVPIED